MKDCTHICLWSTPRSRSTAMVYSFAQRPDTTVHDGPLSPHLLKTRDEYILRRYQIAVPDSEDVNQIVKEIFLSNPNPSKPIVFIKQMACALVGLEEEFLIQLKNIIYIREPEEVICSFLAIRLSENLPSASDITVDLIGVKKQWKIFETLSAKAELRKLMPQSIPRKVLKQTVMTTVYGVTEYGAREQVERQLKALDIDSKPFPGYLTRNTFASLDKAFTKSMMLKKWFQGCASQVASLHQTMQWESPLGLPVYQPYLEAERMFGHLYLKPNKSKQVNAFPLNFVHSLDSTHMMLTSLFCRQKGLTFAAVHDCFWTHASDVDEMNAICRDQFIALHEFPIIERLSEFLIKTYVEELPISEEEKKKMSQKFVPNTSSGTLNIKDVKNSVYFFS